MKIISVKNAMSAGAFALAIAGALTTSAMERNTKPTAVVSGYQKNNDLGTACTLRNDCSDVFSANMCTIGQVSGATQLWGIHPTTGRCTVPLYRP